MERPTQRNWERSKKAIWNDKLIAEKNYIKHWKRHQNVRNKGIKQRNEKANLWSECEDGRGKQKDDSRNEERDGGIKQKGGGIKQKDGGI